MEKFQTNMSSSWIESILKIEADFPNKLKQYLVLQSDQVKNPWMFIRRLLSKGILCDRWSDSDAILGLKKQMIELAMMIACAKGAEGIGSLIEALEDSGNSQLISDFRAYVKQDFCVETESDFREPKGDLSAAQTPKSVVLTNEPGRPTFFERLALPDGLSKLAAFKCPQKSAMEGTSFVQFDKERMMACSADGTLHLWNLQEGKEEPVQVAAHVEEITCFQFDEEIFVLGTAQGAVHRFDARTFEEKCSSRFGHSTVSLLKFLESTLVIVTRSANEEKLWWVDISGPDLRLLNVRSVQIRVGCENQAPGVFMYPDITFKCHYNMVKVFDTKSGNRIKDTKKRFC